MAAGQWAEATRIFDVIAYEPVTPDDFVVPALLQASSAQLRLGEYRSARRYALDAAAMQPSSPDVVQAVAQALNLFCEPERLAMLVDTTSFDGAPSGVMVELAQILSGFGMHDRAAAMLKSVEGVSDTAHARYLRGLICMFQGQMQRCEVELQKCLLLSPDFAPAYWLLSQVASSDAASARVDKISDLLERGGWNDVAEGYLQYALHNELHELGRYDEAWEALERGCLARKRVVSWKREDARRLFSSLKSPSAPDFARPESQEGELTPIFIVGMHRSGTSLLERILGGHSLVTDGGESYAFGAQVKQSVDRFFADMPDQETITRLRTVDFSELGKNYLEAARWRSGGRPFLTEKLPSNFIYAGIIAKALPQAKILHMVRNPIDTCFSNLRTYFSNAAAYSYDQVDLAEYYVEYESLMAHWNSIIPSRLLAVSYDDLVHSTETTARRIFDFCGLAYEQSALHVSRDSGSVSTASSVTVRKGIRKDRGAVWKPYERHLQPLIGHLKASGLI